MGKTYNTLDKLLATEYNPVVNAAGIYAASSVGTDAYAITVTPTPTSYAGGDTYKFLADVGNTGPATLNVNGLGVKTIKKNYNADLSTGDVLAGQIVEVCYDSANDCFQLISPVVQGVRFKSGIGPSTNGNATTHIDVIPHGLGRVPTFVRILARKIHNGFNDSSYSDGNFDGSAYNSIAIAQSGGAQSVDDGTTFIAKIGDSGTFTANQTATISAIDDVNIEVTWTKTGSPAADNYFYIWEVYA